METPLHTETSRVLSLLQCCTRHHRDLSVMFSQCESERCCSLARRGVAWAIPASVIRLQWLRDRLVRQGQCLATAARLVSLISGSRDRDRRWSSG